MFVPETKRVQKFSELLTYLFLNEAIFCFYNLLTLSVRLSDDISSSKEFKISNLTSVKYCAQI